MITRAGMYERHGPRSRVTFGFPRIRNHSNRLGPKLTVTPGRRGADIEVGARIPWPAWSRDSAAMPPTEIGHDRSPAGCGKMHGSYPSRKWRHTRIRGVIDDQRSRHRPHADQ